ncbi:hypothetical protein [Micromonospora sp. DT31]|uniref:hypothetical protein n=1 Tax=Micromonospora sp. DT31 TaxID=3393434 RepID=UPI003CEC208F
MPRTPHHLAVALLVPLTLAACGTPPELRTPPASPTAAVTTAPASATPTAAPSTTQVTPVVPAPTVSPSGLPATPCRSGPSADRIVAVLRGSAGVLPRGVRVTVTTGPLCAEDWHYTVLAIAGHEELQVVTRGGRGTPILVTAGTDVCGVEVRTVAPAGIRTLACDAGPGA